MIQEKQFRSKARPGEYLDFLYRCAPEEGRQPLVIYIHGSGSRGSSLSELQNVGPLAELRKGRHIPANFVMPQCHADTWFELFDVLLEFIWEQIEQDNVDPARVYLTGSSMGGYTAWQVAMSRPEWFAALVPVCGGGMYWNAGRLKELPVWAFHGLLDKIVLPEESLRMVRAVNEKGGDARITLYPQAAHNAWDGAFGSDELWDWLFSQKKS